jgi:hypothetical protein
MSMTERMPSHSMVSAAETAARERTMATAAPTPLMTEPSPWSRTAHTIAQLQVHLSLDTANWWAN